MLNEPIKSFLEGQGLTIGSTPVDDSREDLFDGIMESTRTGLRELVASDPSAVVEAVRVAAENLYQDTLNFRVPTTTLDDVRQSAVTLMSLVVVVYAQALRDAPEDTEEGEDDDYQEVSLV